MPVCSKQNDRGGESHEGSPPRSARCRAEGVEKKIPRAEGNQSMKRAKGAAGSEQAVRPGLRHGLLTPPPMVLVEVDGVEGAGDGDGGASAARAAGASEMITAASARKRQFFMAGSRRWTRIVREM